MVKDTAKINKNGKVSGLKSPRAIPPSNSLKGGVVKGTAAASQFKDIKRARDDRKSLIKAAVAFSLLLLAMIFWFGGSSRTSIDRALLDKSAIETAAAPPRSGAGAGADEKPGAGGIDKTGEQEAKTGPIVAAVRITPSQPLPGDHIKAEAVLAGGAVDGIRFSYRWKVNGQFIQGEDTDTLANVTLKRKDKISVVVSAARENIEGPPTESQTLIVHSLPPSLEMKIMTDRIRPGDTAEIQLQGAAPDGGKVVFSLVSPFVEGMKLDENSGKIIWTPQRVLQGKLQFGAVAADADGNRTTKVFSLDLDVGASP